MLNNPHLRAIEQFLDGLNFRETMTVFHILALSKKRFSIHGNPVLCIVAALWPLAWLAAINFFVRKYDGNYSSLYDWVEIACYFAIIFEFSKVLFFRMWKREFWELVRLAREIQIND